MISDRHQHRDRAGVDAIIITMAPKIVGVYRSVLYYASVVKTYLLGLPIVISSLRSLQKLYT